MGTLTATICGQILRDLLLMFLFAGLVVAALFGSVRATSASYPQEIGVEVTSPPPNEPPEATELVPLTIIGKASSPWVPLGRNPPLRI